MTEERITRTENPDGSTSTTHTTVINDGNGGGGKWVFLGILVLALAAGIYFFTQMSGAEIAKDNAVEDAANQVGNAAGEVGEAAQQVGEEVQDAAENLNGGE